MRSSSPPPSHSTAVARIGLGALSVAVCGLAIGLAIRAAGLPRLSTPSPQQQAEEYRDPIEHPAYFEAGPFLPGYHFTELPLDRNSAFYPSSATTKSGGFYSQAQLMDVERCADAGCHPDIYDMWYESTHHLASMNDPWYRRTFQFFEERSGQLPAQWCGGCHDPALMMTGDMQGRAEIDFDSAAAQIGISCQFCHSVDAVDPAHANGSYQLSPAAELPYQGTEDPQLRELGNRMLLESPELIAQHKNRRRSYFHSFSLFCASCHKQSLITPVNNYKWLRGFDEFDGWQASGVSGASARSFYYPEEPMVCQTCHMPEVPSDDAGNDNGLVNSHRFLGSNTALSAFHGYSQQLQETVRFLQDGRLRVDLFGVRLDDSSGERVLIAPANRHVIAVPVGVEIGVETVVRTLRIGHLFPGGTVDSNMVWLEFAVLDVEGRTVLLSGGMDEARFIDESAHFYRGVFLDEAGQELDKRNGWDRRAAVYVRMIPPGAADTVHYTFKVPPGVRGPLTLRARLNYRKHKQAYNRWAFGGHPASTQPADALVLPRVDTREWTYDDAAVPELPTVVLAEDQIQVEVVPAGQEATVDGHPVAGSVNVERNGWERLNDYGIGLLRQADFVGAIGAFRELQQIRPEYADGYVNEARAHLQEGFLEGAREALEGAFQRHPEFFKANYFMAQVYLGTGEYDDAVSLLERVKQSYPYDRQVRLDLGRTYYSMGRYADSVDNLLWILDNIDPEELGAHYNLMLSYRAMGARARADIHETRYRRYREDEDIQRLTGPFRRDHPGANLESQPIHIHRVGPAEDRFSAPDRYPWTEFVGTGRFARPTTVFPGPAPPQRLTRSLGRE